MTAKYGFISGDLLACAVCGVAVTDTALHDVQHGTATPKPKPTSTPAEPMRQRTFRCPDSLWDAAITKAEARGDSVPDILRRRLETYVKRG